LTKLERPLGDSKARDLKTRASDKHAYKYPRIQLGQSAHEARDSERRVYKDARVHLGRSILGMHIDTVHKKIGK